MQCVVEYRRNLFIISPAVVVANLDDSTKIKGDRARRGKGRLGQWRRNPRVWEPLTGRVIGIRMPAQSNGNR